MDEVAEALQNAAGKLCEDEELRKKIEVLGNYLDNGQWLADYEADERGELPADVKRGVLSQDGLYNLLCEVKGLCRETGTCSVTDKKSEFNDRKKEKWYERLFTRFREKKNY